MMDATPHGQGKPLYYSYGGAEHTHGGGYSMKRISSKGQALIWPERLLERMHRHANSLSV